MKSRGEVIFDHLSVGGGLGSVIGVASGYVLSTFVINSEKICHRIVPSLIERQLNTTAISFLAHMTTSLQEVVIQSVQSGLMQGCIDMLGAGKVIPCAYFAGWSLGIVAGAAYGYYQAIPFAEVEVKAVVEPMLDDTVVLKQPDNAQPLVLTASASTLFAVSARKSAEQKKGELLRYSQISQRKLSLSSGTL